MTHYSEVSYDISYNSVCYVVLADFDGPDMSSIIAVSIITCNNDLDLPPVCHIPVRILVVFCVLVK